MVLFQIQALGDNSNILSEFFSMRMSPLQVLFLIQMLFLESSTTIILAMVCLKSRYPSSLKGVLASDK